MLKAQVNVSEVYISPNKEPQIPYVLLCVSEAALEWPSKASKEKQMSTFLLKLLFGVIWVFFLFTLISMQNSSSHCAQLLAQIVQSLFI